MTYNMDDYVDVAERLHQFFARYPDGSVQADPAEPVHVGDRDYLRVVVRAYRTPEDSRPAVAQAWEPWPGRTPYTKDSEAMVAETSAAGRALAFLGFAAKRVATADEVRAREGEPVGSPPEDHRPVTDAQKRKLGALFTKRGLPDRAVRLQVASRVLQHEVGSVNDLDSWQASVLIDRLTDLTDEQLRPLLPAETTP